MEVNKINQKFEILSVEKKGLNDFVEIKEKSMLIKGPKGKKEVSIEADRYERSTLDSFAKGMLKGTLTLASGIYYPFLVMGYGAFSGAINSYLAAKDVGVDKENRMKVACLGGVLKGLDGVKHGVIDFFNIALLTTAGAMLGGPIGGILGATIGGGIYNIVKDKIMQMAEKKK